MPSKIKGGHNLRNLNSSKGSDADSPSVTNRSRRGTTPNTSPNTSRLSYREHNDEEDEDEDQYTDSQEDDVDSSYATTRASPTPMTPSPKIQRRDKLRGNVSDSDTSPILQHRANRRGDMSGSDTSPQYKNIYPDLSTMQKDERPAGPAAPKKQTSSSMPPYMWIGLVIPVLIILGVLFSASLRKPPSRSPSFQAFVSTVDDLQSSFKSQDKRTWKTIKSSVKHILNATDPGYPAVVLFAVRKDHPATASCLARRVASLFNHLTSSVGDDGYVDARLLNHLEARDQKESLDDKIRANFKSGRSVVIDHLEGLSPLASLLLHGICDNDNAPFKNVFIGIVFYVDRELTVRDVDIELEKYFKSELDMDKIGALLTRINNNAVVVRKEEGDISSLCS
ncbi:torsin-1A-interacting protein 2-like [Haliotis rubra]|uniref:torsin-1A-interacting protein 2-like n=1 Tax=Haliotis rubra TaxID=36100 RepID=UPI001EE59912|nr:torsin-1A-interacting protein 2-like [Haliotis rubra]XP_046583663.1 torsin-1A-interacting protein 2-like [Haliotis rubra]